MKNSFCFNQLTIFQVECFPRMSNFVPFLDKKVSRKTTTLVQPLSWLKSNDKLQLQMKYKPLRRSQKLWQNLEEQRESNRDFNLEFSTWHHNSMKFWMCQIFYVWLNDERTFRLSNENVSCSIDALANCCSQDWLENPAKIKKNPLHCSKIVQNWNK